VAIRNAQAFVEEVPEAASSSIADLASCSQFHSERDTHRLTKRFQLSLDIPISEMLVGDVNLPFLKMSDWAKFFVSHGLWYHLAGMKKPSEDTKTIWQRFWGRYRAVNPKHEVFSRKDLDLGNTCGYMIHGDEGRSQEKAPILVVAAHSVLGFGLRTSTFPHDDLKLNYESPTWTTRFLLAVAPRTVYADSDDHIQTILHYISADMKDLYEKGVVGPDGETMYFCPIALMGDWPFIAKAGSLSRTFLNISKHPNARSDPKGICHRCQADRRGWAWENFEVDIPEWLPSENTLDPYEVEPGLLMLPMDRSNTPKFFTWDIFHAWHLGAGKHFMATAFVLLAMSAIYAAAGAIDRRIDAASSDFFAWCKATKNRPYIRKLSKDTLGWQQTSNYPVGGWSKGMTTTTIMKFFLAKCLENENIVQGDRLLLIAYKAAKHMNTFLRGLYKWELFIPSGEAEALALQGMAFLRMFGRGARAAAEMKKSFFYLLPNHHRIHHVFWDMLTECDNAAYCLNPLYSATQADEDFIGRPSRISRRVSPRAIALRTIQRSLITAFAKYKDSGLIIDAA